MNRTGYLAAVIFSMLVFFAGCSFTPNPEKVLFRYLDSCLHDNYDKAYELLSSEDQEFLGDFKKLEDKAWAMPFDIEEVGVTGEKAQFRVTFNVPASDRMRMRAEGNPFSEIEPFPQLYNLVKEKDGWRVYMGWKNKALKAKEKQAYFPNIEVRNVKIWNGLSYSGVSGELKNKGDRSLKRVEVTAYCLDKDGKAVFDFKTNLPASSISNRPGPIHDNPFGFQKSKPLKPNYSWSFSYNLDDAPSDWSGEVRLEVTNLEFE